MEILSIFIIIGVAAYAVYFILKIISKNNRESTQNNSDVITPQKSTRANDIVFDLPIRYSIETFDASEIKNIMSDNLLNFIKTSPKFQNNTYSNEADFLEHVFYECYTSNQEELANEILEIFEENCNDYTKLHFMYNCIIEDYYKLRDADPSALSKCEMYCLNDLNILPLFFHEIDQDLPNQKRPHIPALKRLIIIYEKQKEYPKAIELCKIAIQLNLDDGTQGGYLGRLEKLIKKNNNSSDTKNAHLRLIYDSKNVKQVFNFKIAPKKQPYIKVKTFVDNYVLLDFETTGLSPIDSEIIEIGAIKIADNIEVARFHSFVKPTQPIPDYITEINGITNEMVQNAESIDKILPDLIQFIDGNILVGHNVSFDIRFLIENCNLCNIATPNISAINTLPFARKYIPTENHQLQTLKDFLNIKEESHRAISDCVTTNAVYQFCREKFLSEKHINP